MKTYYLGIDTSNYKTSLSIINEDGDIVFNKSVLLDVKKGALGLRQSDAFFMHSNRLPDYVQEAFAIINPQQIKAIGVSTRPRRVDGSYMPCFLAGYNCAKELSLSLNIPLYEFSHQEGHSAAVIESKSNTNTLQTECFVFHLSGGTTEFLLCEEDELGYSMKIVGGTKDISFGQLIDRIGVSYGIDFPAGPAIDKYALNCNENIINLPRIKIDKAYFNLSGHETLFQKHFKDNNDISLVSKTLLFEISNTIYRSAYYLNKEYSINNFYLVGGVSSSEFVRNQLNKLCLDDCNETIFHFGSPELSSDNAVGIAILTRRLDK